MLWLLVIFTKLLMFLPQQSETLFKHGLSVCSSIRGGGVWLRLCQLSGLSYHLATVCLQGTFFFFFFLILLHYWQHCLRGPLHIRLCSEFILRGHQTSRRNTRLHELYMSVSEDIMIIIKLALLRILAMFSNHFEGPVCWPLGTMKIDCTEKTAPGDEF